MTPSSLSLEVRLAEPTDLAQIAEFLLPLGGPSFPERFPGRTAQDFYRWKYFQNPLGDAIVGIAIAGDAIVSVVAAAPKRIWISGKVVLAYELGDFLTDGSHRKQGLFSKLIELVCSKIAACGAAFVYVRPNDASFSILAGKLGFFEAQRLDARRLIVPSQALSRKTGIPASLLRLSGMDKLLRDRCVPHFPKGGITVVPAQRFGEETDELWARASADYNFALVRDSSYLNWRFSDCPTPYRMLRAVRSGHTVGFLVASAERANLAAAIVDLFTDGSDEEAVEGLVATAIGDLLGRGMQLISTWTLQRSAVSDGHKMLQRAFPFRRKQHLHLAFRVLHSHEIPSPLPSQKWQFTLGDSDGA